MMTDDDLDQLRALVHRDIEQRKELEQTVVYRKEFEEIVVSLSDRVEKLEQRIETFERYLDEGNG